MTINTLLSYSTIAANFVVISSAIFTICHYFKKYIQVHIHTSDTLKKIQNGFNFETSNTKKKDSYLIILKNLFPFCFDVIPVLIINLRFQFTDNKTLSLFF